MLNDMLSHRGTRFSADWRYNDGVYKQGLILLIRINFNPTMDKQSYTQWIMVWNWQCNCKGNLIPDWWYNDGVYKQGLILLIRINFNPSMDKQSYAQWIMVWNWQCNCKGNLIPLFIIEGISYLYWDTSTSMLINEVPGIMFLNVSIFFMGSLVTSFQIFVWFNECDIYIYIYMYIQDLCISIYTYAIM